MKIVYETGGKNAFTTGRQAITVYQSAGKKKLFKIVYGLQVRDDLTYAQCCAELGSCILHNLCCEGIASNEGL